VHVDGDAVNGMAAYQPVVLVCVLCGGRIKKKKKKKTPLRSSCLLVVSYFVAIAAEKVDDVRDVLDYYHQFTNPVEAFRENQRKLLVSSQLPANSGLETDPSPCRLQCLEVPTCEIPPQGSLMNVYTEMSVDKILVYGTRKVKQICSKLCSIGGRQMLICNTGGMLCLMKNYKSLKITHFQVGKKIDMHADGPHVLGLHS
jgi:hypothetical protein